MRLLHKFDNQKQALQFSSFLNEEKIPNECEIKSNTDWGSDDYGTFDCSIWIIDEDDMEKAEKWLKEYLANPSAPNFQPSKPTFPLNPFTTKSKVEEKVEGPGLAKARPENLRGLTLYLLILCTIIFIYGQLTTPPIQTTPAALPAIAIFSPPINKELMYDYPRAYEVLDKFISAYGIDKLNDLSELPEQGRQLLEQFLKTPYWTGIYDKALDYFVFPGKPTDWNAPLFEKIRKGEVWRIFTPCLLHLNILHIFFNMVWLLVLGKLVEERLGTFRYALVLLITAAFSNTCQYLMSGSGFIGISGVICALLGFIWARQQVAAWEGYNLQQGTLSFLLFFILAMAGLQLAAFLIEAIWKIEIGIAIANTAHISGLICGYLLGRLPIFSIKLT